MKVAVIVGVILSSPIWLYQIWAFAAPGLHAREKRWSCLFLGAAIPLFGIGITLCYLSLGRSMHYLLGLTPGGVENLIGVDQYISFATATMLAFGLVFEVPLLIVMLNLAGVLTHERFRKWRALIFGVFLIAGMPNPSPPPPAACRKSKPPTIPTRPSSPPTPFGRPGPDHAASGCPGNKRPSNN